MLLSNFCNFLTTFWNNQFLMAKTAIGWFYPKNMAYKVSKHLREEYGWRNILYFLFWLIKSISLVQFCLIFSYSMASNDWKVKTLHWSNIPIHLWDFIFDFKFLSIIILKLSNFFPHYPMKPSKLGFGQRNGPNLNLHHWSLFKIGMELVRVMSFHIF